MGILKFPALLLLCILLFLAPKAGTNISNGINKVDISREYLLRNYSRNIYQDLGNKDLDYELFHMALKGYNLLKQENLLKNHEILSIIDFRKSSNNKRLFVIDLERRNIEFYTWVAHGINSGLLSARSFSNRPRSFQSSLGFYVTNETYIGSNGLSLRLDGLEKNINNNARKRNIVIHGAQYVSKKFIKQRGHLGRSYGCPALPIEETKAIIETIKNKSCLFIYYPDNNYVNHSAFLNGNRNNVTYPETIISSD